MSLENEQLSFDSEQKENKRVTVLGMEFENDDARREYFREELRKKLPELKKIDGYPIGGDEEIITLSDPPFYTACPNPWINDWIGEWQNEDDEDYVRKPYVDDVVEGKSNGVYRAHKYHTKVPHRAIMKFILHYTNPGDVVFDGFCGTGMTGVASEFCGNVSELEKMGYTIAKNGDIFKSGDQEPFSKIGARHSVLSDLAPAATFIAENYNFTTSNEIFNNEIDRVTSIIKDQYGWMYSMTDESGNIGEAEAIVWSDIFICSNCGEDFVFWETAVDSEIGGVKNEFECPNCGALQTKRSAKRKFITTFDLITNTPYYHAEQVPVLYSGMVNGKRVIKSPAPYEMDILKKIDDLDVNLSLNNNPMPTGLNSQQANGSHGFSSVHHYYSKRNLIILDKLWQLCKENRSLMFAFTGISNRASLMNRIHLKNFFFGGGGWNPGEQPGTLQIASLPIETSVIKLFNDRKQAYKELYSYDKKFKENVISTSSATQQPIKDNSIDYVFVDPPFGANINYSELNYLWESWLNVKTNNTEEAIENDTQGKGLFEYHQLMIRSFKEIYRILKPNHWMTIEFSNTNASVWNAIQSSINEAGFVIANVSALNKKQGGFKSVVTTTAVKQDLVISAYKPSDKIVQLINKERNTENSTWTFINQHLSMLPIFQGSKGMANVISERTPRILFDRLVAYHVQHGISVMLSSPEFQEKVQQRYPMRDGMVFLESQVAEYDKKRILASDFSQQSLFVSDEMSAIEWIRQRLMKKPQTRQDIQPEFMKEIQHIAKHEELPELDELLQQNFLVYNGNGSVPSQIRSYLTKNYHELRGFDSDNKLIKEKAKNRWYVPNPNQQADLEKLREKNLLREFSHYLDEINNSKKKLKVFRTEAIRVGFKKAWTEKEYQTIVTVGERLPEKVIQEDDKLLMYYDNALMRTEM